MQGDDGEQQKEDGHHEGDDASRDPRSIETDHMWNKEARRILNITPIDEVICAVAVFVGLVMSEEEIRTTSLAQ